MMEVDLILHILASLPPEYEVAVSVLEDKLMDDAQKCDIKTVRQKLNERFEQLKKQRRDENSSQSDAAKALAAFDGNEEAIKAFAAFMKQFKGTCNKCGEYGHKGADCNKKPAASKKMSSGSGSFSGKCYHCGIKGRR